VAASRWTEKGWVTDDKVDARDSDVWVFETVVRPMKRNTIAIGLSREERDSDSRNFDEMPKGCYDPAARLADMDLCRVEASLCFPQNIRFCGQEFSEVADKELGLACIEAYNDWMVEEWSAFDPKRLISMIIVPLWDGELAAREIYRNAARGCHAVTFSENPSFLGFASIHSGEWEPFFRACSETETTINMHIGSSSRMAVVSPDSPLEVTLSLTATNAMSSMMEYIFSGVLERYPTLQLAYSESQVGWIPYQLERADSTWRDHHGSGGQSRLPNPPSFYYFRQIYGCFFRDFFGMKNLEAVGENNVTFEMDYPHADSTWPHTHELAQEMLAALTDEQKYKICRGNAIRMLHLDLD
jgi:predicted TIM-barrel fold metal-dependent hydrolase